MRVIEVVRIIGDKVIPLFTVDGDEFSNIELAREYGFDGMDEEKIKKLLWDNPYLNYREVE